LLDGSSTAPNASWEYAVVIEQIGYYLAIPGIHFSLPLEEVKMVAWAKCGVNTVS
jgi:hypothetical protein